MKIHVIRHDLRSSKKKTLANICSLHRSGGRSVIFCSVTGFLSLRQVIQHALGTNRPVGFSETCQHLIPSNVRQQFVDTTNDEHSNVALPRQKYRIFHEILDALFTWAPSNTKKTLLEEWMMFVYGSCLENSILQHSRIHPGEMRDLLAEML